MLAAKCSGSGAVTSIFLLVGVVDDQPPRMEVHLAADAAGEERLAPAVLAVAHDRVADRRHVRAQLVRAPGERFELHPRGGGCRARSTTR